MNYKLIDNGPTKYFETPDGRLLSVSPLAVLDELTRIHAARITKPEPSRLEIAAMIYAAWQSCSEVYPGCTIEAAVKFADALIAEARKEAQP